MRFKTISILLVLFTISATLEAQTYMGLRQSNLGGIHQASLNPAWLAGSRHRMYLNALTAGFGFNNDYLGLELPFPFYQVITNNYPSQYRNSNGGLEFQDNWLTERVNGKSKNLNLYIQTLGPGFMIQPKKGFAIGIQYKNTFSFQINEVAEPLARLARYGVDSSNGSVAYSGPNNFKVGENFGDNAFTVNLNAYGEIGIPIAKTIIEDVNYSFKAGITPKVLLGYGTGYIRNKGLSFRAPGSDTIIFNQMDVEYGYTDPEYLNDQAVVNYSFLKNKLNGYGFGWDFGLAFQVNSKVTQSVTSSKNNYLFRAGASLLDMGKITYNKNLKNTHITNGPNDKYFLIDAPFTSAWSQGSDRGLEYTDSVMRSLFNVDTSTNKIVTTLPTTLNLQFDYNVIKFFYVGANISQSFRSVKSVGIRKPSSLMIIPRIETRVVEFALPLGLQNDYKNPRLGFYFRLGPVFLGSDNLIGQLRTKNIFGSDLYFGVSTGILTGKKKQEDQEVDKTY